jgi:hypothetical protein
MARQISRNDKRITNLEKGLMADAFETDASVAYVKDVPANALPYAAVTKVGGMTYRDGDTLKNAKVTEIESVGANIFDIDPALNANLVDNGDGTYTFTKSANGRFSKTFPLYIPAGKTANYSLEVVSTNLDNPRIPLQLFDLDQSTEVSTAAMGEGGSHNYQPAKNVYYARMYIGHQQADGSYITFKNPMIKHGGGIIPYTPYAKHTLPIPGAVRPAHGINENAYDYIEWCEDGTRKSYKRVDKIVLNGSEAWSKTTGSNIFQAGCPLSQIAGNTKTIRAIVSNGYGFLDWYNPDASVKPYFRIVPYGDRVWIEATLEQFADLDAWKAHLAANPVEIVYPLAEPIVTDISSLLPSDNMIPVEGGGTITAVNENAFAVPTEITYQLKGVAE